MNHPAPSASWRIGREFLYTDHMKLSIGIVGLPNVGKSTLFKALTKREVDIANYPFCTIDPNVGIVPVPDQRLDRLAELSRSAKKIPAVVEFVDIAGLVKGASEGEGLGNKFLSHIREVSAIAEVVRVFEDEAIHHVHGGVDPELDIAVIEDELARADLLSKPILYVLNSGTKNAPLALNKPHVVLNAETGEGVSELIVRAYDLLGLQTFFTTGEDETRAWTIKKGATAPEAGAAIHTDFMDKFIRCQVISYKDLIEAGSYANARSKGLVRTEGKEYVVKDGDVIEFLI